MINPKYKRISINIHNPFNIDIPWNCITIKVGQNVIVVVNNNLRGVEFIYSIRDIINDRLDRFIYRSIL